jgi:hypothetical protein
MIIEHSSEGEIRHIIFDPVPEGLTDVLQARGIPFLEFPPRPLPDIPALDEDGNPAFDFLKMPLTEDNGTPVLDGEGNQVLVDVPTPRMITGRTENVTADIMTDYILDGQITHRPTFYTPDLISLTAGETFTIVNLPDSCTVHVDENTFELTTGTLELEADMPASYTLVIESWPYLPRTIGVDVHAA